MEKKSKAPGRGVKLAAEFTEQRRNEPPAHTDKKNKKKLPPKNNKQLLKSFEEWEQETRSSRPKFIQLKIF